MKRGNLFANLPETLPEELFETLYATGAMRVERILSRGHVSPTDGDWYEQDDDEWVALLSGRARLRFDGDREDTPLEAGDWLLIPAQRRHRVTWTSEDETCVWLAVHAAPDDTQ